MSVPSERSRDAKALARHADPEHQGHSQRRQDHHQGDGQAEYTVARLCGQPVAQGGPKPGDKGGLAAEGADDFDTAEHLLRWVFCRPTAWRLARSASRTRTWK